VPVVPRTTDHRSKVEAHADPDQIRQQDHHDADKPVVVLARDDRSREEQRGKDTEARDAHRSGETTGKEFRPTQPAEQQDMERPPIEDDGDDEGDDLNGNPRCDTRQLSPDQLLRCEAEEETGRPEQSVGRLRSRSRRILAFVAVAPSRGEVGAD
jgi:hypothetical protein